jgi:hypothetical protein
VSDNVFPSYLTEHLEYHERESYHPRPGTGLTKRELFAALVLQGYVANGDRPRGIRIYDAIAAADDLLSALAGKEIAP